MEDFPDFMKSPENLIDENFQSNGISGWVYDGIDGKQMVYWVCDISGRSEAHVHPYDEYFTVVQGKYTVIIDGGRIDVCCGEEYVIPKHIVHAGEFQAGTRTIHCFGGLRAKRRERSSEK